MTHADTVFIECCQNILQHGQLTAVRPRWSDGTQANAIKIFGVVNRYDLQKEFPILTLRRTYFRSCIDELLWIWQKKSNKVCQLHSHIWDAWADDHGTIGKAYGYQLGVKHQYEDGWYDQVDRVLKDVKENPNSRRMVTSLFNHHDLHEMALYPCAWSVTFNVVGDTLNAVLNQRSQDMLTASNWNVCQYAILVHMIARHAGLKAGELVHVIADCHIYDRHVPIVERLIQRSPRQAPTLIIDQNVHNFYDFTVDSFHLEGYDPYPFEESIEVAV